MRNRALSLLVLTGITIFFAFGLKQVEIRTIFSDLFPKNHEFVKTFKDHPNFGNPLTVTVMVKRKQGDIYNPETLEKIWRMSRDIDLAPAVDHDQILSIATEKSRFSEATPFGINSQPIMGDHAPNTEAEVDLFRSYVNKAPGVQKFLISEDETATMITATFIERLLDYGETFEFIQTMVERERDANHEVYVAGAPMLTGWVYTFETQMLGIFGITAIALIFSLIVYMRNLPGVITPIVVSIVSAIWGFGFVGWIGDPIEPLIMVVPLLLVARAFSHCVQFIERYYENYNLVPDKKLASEHALRVMMAPGTLGIITDATGLFLIAFAPIPVMERFALFCGFWALILVPTNLFLTPILLSYLPAPKNVEKILGKNSSNKGSGHDSIINILRYIGRLSHGHNARKTAGILVFLTLGSLALVSQLKVGNPVEGSNLLWDDSEYNYAVRQINRHFPGLMTLEIVFEGIVDERVTKKADTALTMAKLQRILESQPNPPEATLSFADYLPEANRLFSGGNPKWGPLDNSDEAVNAAASALLLGASTKAYSHVTDFELRNSTVSLWYKDNKQSTVDTALAQTRAALEEVGINHEKFRIRLGTGAIALQQSVNDTVDEYQYVILIALNIVILLTCSFAYRSIWAGILLLVPVNLSNILLGSVMVLMGIGLDVNTLPIASIGIGVGIDYGIYLLSRICEEYRDANHYGNAIQASITTSGKAIFFTASIVLLGILPWYALSGLKFLADMGLLLVMVMLINMIIALIVVPLLVYLFKPDFVSKEHMLNSDAGLLESLQFSTEPSQLVVETTVVTAQGKQVVR
jgi:predicted RND superfamily exporter protein